MRYELIKPSQASEVCGSLLEENFKESGMPGFEFSLSEEVYKALDATPSFIIVAFDDEVVVGLCSVYVIPATHYNALVASNDTLYVSPAYRKTLVAGRLMAMAEREARQRGATLFQWAAGEGTPLDLALSKRSSYRLFQKIYLKEM